MIPETDDIYLFEVVDSNRFLISVSFAGLPRVQIMNDTKVFYFDGQISTDHLEFNRLLYDPSNQSLDTVALEEPKLMVAPIGKHKEIFVKKINGIVWDDFVSSVYLKTNPTPINGMQISVNND